jgi:hypothetical protein
MTLTSQPGGARALLFVGMAVLAGAMTLALRDRWTGAPQGHPSAAAEYREKARQKVRAYLRRVARKEQVVQEVLAGQLNLLEAAALFRALDHGPPEFHWDYFHDRWPGDTDEERHCHEVIDCVGSVLRRAADSRDQEVCARLRAELVEHLCRGTLHLPDLTGHLGSLDDEQDGGAPQPGS